MARRIVLLRGINLGSKRVAMPELRRLLTESGFGDVRTYVASGNVVLEDDGPPEELVRRLEELIEERFGFPVPIVVRTPQELAEVVSRDPLAKVASNPKRYLVTFTATEPASEALEKLEALARGDERMVAIGPEVYSWHPEGVGRSKLWAALAGRGLGVTATSRNWATVNALNEMATGG